jgi:hypothetical protein
VLPNLNPLDLLDLRVVSYARSSVAERKDTASETVLRVSGPNRAAFPAGTV